MNNGAYDIAKAKFRELLIAGAFPKVGYEESEGSYGGKNISYSMMDYSIVWATFTKVIQKELIAKGFEFGLWQNARNSEYICAVEEVVATMTEEKVKESGSERFRTMWD